MTPVSWPTSVPICVRRNAATGAPQEARTAFQPGVGAAITRPRTTTAPEIYSVPLDPITPAQFEAFQAWFAQDLAQGSNPFLFPHPITKRPRAWRFTVGEAPYRVAQTAKGYVVLTFQIIGLPVDPWFAAYVPANSGRVPRVVADYDQGVFGVDGVQTAAAAVALVAGTFDVHTLSDTDVLTIEEDHVVQAGDIPAAQPANVKRILAFDP